MRLAASGSQTSTGQVPVEQRHQARMLAFLRLKRDHPGCHALVDAARVDVAIRNGVLCAYGTHHLDHASLIETCEEARRVIRSGGRIVLHDFEPDSAVSGWFSEVVHRYSRKGHAYQHYGSEILTKAINGGGFENVTSRPLFDPIIAAGASPAEARLALAQYLFQMYGLVGLGDCAPEEGGPYRACLPRVAVLAVGCVPVR